MVQILNFTNDVVVQLELGQLLKPGQIVDFDDVFVGETQVLQLPQRCLILIVDLILLVIFHDILPDEDIINDGRLDSLLFFFGFSFSFKSFGDL